MRLRRPWPMPSMSVTPCARTEGQAGRRTWELAVVTVARQLIGTRPRKHCVGLLACCGPRLLVIRQSAAEPSCVVLPCNVLGGVVGLSIARRKRRPKRATRLGRPRRSLPGYNRSARSWRLRGAMPTYVGVPLLARSVALRLRPAALPWGLLMALLPRVRAAGCLLAAALVIVLRAPHRPPPSAWPARLPDPALATRLLLWAAARVPLRAVRLRPVPLPSVRLLALARLALLDRGTLLVGCALGTWPWPDYCVGAPRPKAMERASPGARRAPRYCVCTARSLLWCGHSSYC
jgi:hypothetical protein